MAIRIRKALKSAFKEVADFLGLNSIREFMDLPGATYKIGGSVTDEDGNPVEGIKVYSKFVINDYEFIEQYDTLRTDAKGFFRNTYYNLPMDCIEFTFMDESGTYAPKTITISPVQVLKGDSEWYSGEYSATAAVCLDKIQ